MNEFLFTFIFGLPLVIWIIFWWRVIFQIYFTWVWGMVFDKYIWNRDYMREILGDEFMRLHG